MSMNELTKIVQHISRLEAKVNRLTTLSILTLCFSVVFSLCLVFTI